MTESKPNHVYRVRWRRDHWLDPSRWSVRYYETEVRAHRFIDKLLTPRPGDALPVRVRLESCRREPWAIVLEDFRDGDELFGDPSWRIDRW